MKRRTLLGMMTSSAAVAAAPGLAGGETSAWRGAWQDWTNAFLSSEGRVVDALQDNASHSEGQAWGMLLTVAFNDADAFARMFAWTEQHLAVRQDPLLAWRWRPGEGVRDFNNASDGDLFYAWALLRASREFAEPRYAERAGKVARAIDMILVREMPGGGLLLRPAAERFSAPGAETVNPSYYMPLALHALAAAFDLPRLAQVADDGEALLARIARRGLVPDWVVVTAEGLSAPDRLPAGYGYDALRVPLYLVWSGRFAHPAVSRVRSLLTSPGPGGVPVRAEVESGRTTERSDAQGYAAVAALVTCAGRPLPDDTLPAFSADQAYYPATLHLLAVTAASEAAAHCLG